MYVVVKVGGSLEPHKSALTKLMHTLVKLASKHAIIVVPGGGSFADKVREATSTYNLSDLVAHRMAILAMDQYGLLLSGLAERCTYTHSLTEAKEEASKGSLPIYLPSRELLFDQTLEASWDVTSDSIAAYTAWRCGSDFLVLLKDVDGVFTADPKKNSKAKLIRSMSASALRGYGCVDKALPTYIQRFNLVCWVLNGLKCGRLRSLLTVGRAVGTKITP
jgi:aspartokinase-like uncharacterized kinase